MRAFSLQTDGYHAPAKDPNAVLDYAIDWGNWLGADNIATSVWTVPSGLVQGPQTIDPTFKMATIWLSCGTAGQTYTLHNRITTTGGRSNDQTFKLTIKEN